MPSIATDVDGGVLIMFRNNVQGARDLYLVRSNDGGESFDEAEKLGTGTWPINGCPMDGGGLDAVGREVMTVWQRKGEVFRSAPGQPEVLIGSGRFPAIASNEDGAYIAWNQGKNVMVLSPGRSTPENLGTGSYPKVVSLADGEGAVGVWIEGGRVVSKRLPR